MAIPFIYKTFETEAESRAFMLGFLARDNVRGIGAHLDIKEPEAVLVDCCSDYEVRGWKECVAEYDAGFPNNRSPFPWCGMAKKPEGRYPCT